MSMEAAIQKLRELRKTYGAEQMCIISDDKIPINQINRILGTNFQNITYCGVYYIWGNNRGNNPRTRAGEHLLEIYIVSNGKIRSFERRGMREEEILKDRYFEFLFV